MPPATTGTMWRMSVVGCGGSAIGLWGTVPILTQRASLGGDQARSVRESSSPFGLGFLACEDGAGSLQIQSSVPPGNDHGRHCVTNQVRNRTRLRHEAIDAEQQRKAGNGDRWKGGQRSR